MYVHYTIVVGVEWSGDFCSQAERAESITNIVKVAISQEVGLRCHDTLYTLYTVHYMYTVHCIVYDIHYIYTVQF